MKTPEVEAVYLADDETFADVITHLPYFIDEVDDTSKLNSAIGHRSSSEFGELQAQQTDQSPA